MLAVSSSAVNARSNEGEDEKCLLQVRVEDDFLNDASLVHRWERGFPDQLAAFQALSPFPGDGESLGVSSDVGVGVKADPSCLTIPACIMDASCKSQWRGSQSRRARMSVHYHFTAGGDGLLAVWTRGWIPKGRRVC